MASARPEFGLELDHGHPIRRALTGGDGARNALLGGQVLNSDPDVTEAGFVPSAKARRELLRTAFELRFGSLTADVAQALDALPRDRLDTVLARALTVATAEAALAP